MVCSIDDVYVNLPMRLEQTDWSQGKMWRNMPYLMGSQQQLVPQAQPSVQVHHLQIQMQQATLGLHHHAESSMVGLAFPLLEPQTQHDLCGGALPVCYPLRLSLLHPHATAEKMSVQTEVVCTLNESNTDLKVGVTVGWLLYTLLSEARQVLKALSNASKWTPSKTVRRPLHRLLATSSPSCSSGNKGKAQPARSGWCLTTPMSSWQSCCWNKRPLGHFRMTSGRTCRQQQGCTG